MLIAILGPLLLPARQPGQLSSAMRIALGACAVIGVLMLFGAAMTQAVTYDEDQYIAAGILARSWLPYRDFLYLQAPLYAFVLGGLFKLSGGYFLLTGRLLTFFLALTSAALLWRLLRRLGAGKELAAVLMAACLTSPFLASALSNSRNDALPLTLMLAGLLLHLATGRGFWKRMAVALLFGLAVEAKVSYLFGAAMLGVYALLNARERLWPVLLGTLVAALPAMLCYAAAPEAFRFGLLDIHLTATPEWYGREGLSALLTAPVRLRSLLGWLAMGGNLTLLMLAIALLVTAILQRRSLKAPGGMLAGLLAGAVVFGFLPSPAWPMYYAAVPPLLACCITHLCYSTVAPIDARAMRILIGIAALPLVPMLILNAPDVANLTRPGLWVGIAAHRTAVAIHEALPPADWAEGEVATLFPTLVADMSPIRPEFATGPFVFRSGDFYSKTQLARLHALSPSTLADAFDRHAPAAIYAGLYRDTWKTPMDAALIQYAEEHGWHLARTDPDGARLWLRP